MKTKFIWTLLLCGACLMPAGAKAQVYGNDLDDDVYVIEKTDDIPANETKKERKQRIKKDKDIVDSVYHLKALNAIKQRYFVIQATQVGNMYGQVTMGLDDNTNFLLIQGDKGIFQVSISYVHPGPNGLGGITLHGNVGKMDIREDKKGNITTSFNMNGSQMSGHVSISMSKGSDMVWVTIDPTMGGGRITMRGRLVPYRNDDIRITP